LPRLGSRVRIPSPAPNRLPHQPRKPMVQRLSAIFIRYIAGSALCRGRKPGTAAGPAFEALSRRVACRFRWRPHQKAAFASGDFIDVRLSSRNGGQSKGCCDNPCSVAIARPEPARPGCRNLDTAILLGWGARWSSLLDGKGRSHASRRMPFSFSKLLSLYACSISAIWR
jgi:hypothetical protein